MKMVKKLFFLFTLGFLSLFIFACSKNLDQVISKVEITQREVVEAKDLVLPEKIDNTQISWCTNNETYKVEGNTLKVPNLPSEDVIVKVTATITKGSKSATKDFLITIKAAAIVPEETFKVEIPSEVVAESPKDLDLTKVKKGTKITFKVNVPENKELSEVKVNGEKVEVKDNKFIAIVNSNITVEVTFNDLAYVSVFEALTKNNDQLVNIKGIIIEQSKSQVILGSNDNNTHIKLFTQDAFKTFKVGDEIKVTAKKVLDEKRNVQFINCTNIEKVSEQNPFIDNENVLSKDNYNLDYLNQLFNSSELEVVEIAKKDENSIKHFILKDKDNNQYKAYISGSISTNENIKKVKIGDKLELRNVRLAYYEGLQFEVHRLNQLYLYVADPEAEINKVKDSLTFPSEVAHGTKLNLIKEKNNVQISWSATPEGILDLNTGIVTGDKDEEKTITLKATLKLQDKEATKEFSIKVQKRPLTAEEIIEQLTSPIQNNELLNNPVNLPKTIKANGEDITISWKVEPTPLAGTITGDALQPNLQLANDTQAKLIATINYGGVEVSKEFSFTAKKNSDSTEEKLVKAIEQLKSQLNYNGTSIEKDADENIILPETIGTFNITWEETTDDKKLTAIDNHTFKLTTSTTTEVDVKIKATITLDGESKSLEIDYKLKHYETYNVEFDLNGGEGESTPQTQQIKQNQKAMNPNIKPYKKNGGYIINWAKDSEGTQIFNFNTEITENIKLYAIYEKVTKIKDTETDHEYLINGVIVGVSYYDKEKTAYYLVNDGTGLLQVVHKGVAQDQLLELHQNISVRGKKEIYESKNKTHKSKQIYLDQASMESNNYYVLPFDKDQVVPTVEDGSITELTPNFNFKDNFTTVVKFKFVHSKSISASTAYEIIDEHNNKISLNLKFVSGNFLSATDLKAIQDIFEKGQFGVYEVIALISGDQNTNEVYLYDVKCFKKLSDLTDQQKVDAAKDSLRLDKDTLTNDGELTVPTKVGDIDITWNEENTNLLTIANSKIKLTDPNITDDKEITIKAALSLNGVSATKTFVIKFLKPGQPLPAESSIYNFKNNKGDNSTLNAATLKNLLEKNKQGQSQLDKVEKAENTKNGENNGGYGDAPQKNYLKSGTGKKDGIFNLVFLKNVKKVKVKVRAFNHKKDSKLKINGVEQTVSKGQDFKEYTFDLTASKNVNFEIAKGQPIIFEELEFIFE